MAKDVNDNVTGNLFNPTQLENILLALQTQGKVYQRKINTEPNEQVKQIYRNSLQSVNDTINHIHGLKS